MSKETVLSRVQRLLNVEPEKLAQLEEIIEIQYDALLAKLVPTSLPSIVPSSLEFIVVETSIARYNRLGSEGLASEGVDVISQSFIEDLFEPYMTDISRFNSNMSNPKKKLKLI
ncbi:hypothetical protein MXL49_16700 [Enterococcus casseliflavus]|uniref:phage head-tail connector protein n=1 Tax=Enterococcus casseliflavus TaxID=37734 RepID=UPI002DBF3278|nr:phage head-tail connector protein [Enterococcus casseliflavus]MEB6213522.1 hypothetical protein [Enterococcus casseliflavus]